jgi:uncharacterized membrane protein YkoI
MQQVVVMQARLKRLAMVGLAGLVLAMPAAARADDDNDHDLARDLYEHGRIRPLFEIIRTVRAHTAGDIVAVDLAQAGEGWVYRFQIVAPDGRRQTLRVDAATGSIIPGVGGDP